MGDEDLIIIDPYHYKREYTRIVAAIRKGKGRKFLFSFLDREREGSIFGSHTAHSIIKIVKSKRGFRFIVIKSVITKEIEIPNSIWDLYGKVNEEGLLRWLV